MVINVYFYEQGAHLILLAKIIDPPILPILPINVLAIDIVRASCPMGKLCGMFGRISLCGNTSIRESKFNSRPIWILLFHMFFPLTLYFSDDEKSSKKDDSNQHKKQICC